LDGSILREESKRVALTYGESVCQYRLDFSAEILKHGANSIYLRVELTTDEGPVSRQTAFFTAPRNLKLEGGAISSSLEQKAAKVFELTLCSQVFQHAVQSHFEGLNYRAEDNFFDLYPGEPRTVEIETIGAEGRALDDLRAALHTNSLVDSYRRS
jgi:beta-mannosidase